MIFVTPQIQTDDIPFGNATPVTQAINITPVSPDIAPIYQSGGLGAATEPAPYIAPIMSTESVPNLDIPVLIQPSEPVMPTVASEPTVDPEEVIQEYAPPVEKVVTTNVTLKKVGLLDKLTNYIYKLIFTKNGLN